MSAGIIVAIVVAVVVIAALVIGLMAATRRRRLQQRFGPEYDRLVGQHDNKRKAEAELTERERRVQDLDIRPLTASARSGYTLQWATLQEQFVDMPADAVAASQVLVAAAMNERGYPTDSRDQVIADLSVEHAGTLDRYRAADKISESAAAGTASTEDLRQAMIHYRALFRELLGEPAEPADPDDPDDVPDASLPAEDLEARDRAAGDLAARDRAASETPVAGTWGPAAADEPGGNGHADIPVQRTPRS